MLNALAKEISINIAANFITDFIGVLSSKKNVHDQQPRLTAPQNIDEDLLGSTITSDGNRRLNFRKNYHTYYTTKDFEPRLAELNKPCVYVVFERENHSSAWYLPIITLEDSITGEWFVFEKGWVALEGCGGGISNFYDLMLKSFEKKASVSTWVLDYYYSEKLSQGCALWPEVKNKCIPLETVSRGSEKFKLIHENYNKIVSEIAEL